MKPFFKKITQVKNRIMKIGTTYNASYRAFDCAMPLLEPGTYRLFSKYGKPVWGRCNNRAWYLLSLLRNGGLSLFFSEKRIVPKQRTTPEKDNPGECLPKRFHENLCTEAMVTRANIVKVFDYKNEKVYSAALPFNHCLINNSKRFLAEIAPYYGKSADVILNIDETDNIVTERFFSPSLKPGNKDTDRFLDFLFQGFEKRINSAAVLLKTCSISELVSKITANTKDTLVKELTERLYEICRELPDAVPVLFSHNDLTPDNTFFHDGNFYLFDYADSMETLFFYDLMNVLFRLEDTSYLIRYLTGEYDEIYTASFSAAGYKFDPKRRGAYAALFLLFALNLRVNQIHELDGNIIKREALICISKQLQLILKY